MTWAIVLRGVEGTPAEVNAAVARARLALGVPCGGSVTVEEWLLDDATQGKLREERKAAA